MKLHASSPFWLMQELPANVDIEVQAPGKAKHNKQWSAIPHTIYVSVFLRKHHKTNPLNVHNPTGSSKGLPTTKMQSPLGKLTKYLSF